MKFQTDIKEISMTKVFVDDWINTNVEIEAEIGKL